MIGFGELRKFSAQWQVDITAVERLYVIDWILKGIFDHPLLGGSLVLRGGAVLRYTYSAGFPVADDPEFRLTQKIDAGAMSEALTASLKSASAASELKFPLVTYERGSGKIEYTGPLGRRSAAQPRVTLSIVAGQTRFDPTSLPLLHPFSDDCRATISAIALDELAGEQIAALARTPRARDVFNLWFVLTQLGDRLDIARVKQIMKEKNAELSHAALVFDPKHRAILERAWDKALRDVREHPTLAQVEKDLGDALKA